MLQITPQMKILVAVEPADFRRGIDGLARLCQEALRHDPFAGAVFVFRNRKATALKLLMYDGQGFWLCHSGFRRAGSRGGPRPTTARRGAWPRISWWSCSRPATRRGPARRPTGGRSGRRLDPALTNSCTIVAGLLHWGPDGMPRRPEGDGRRSLSSVSRWLQDAKRTGARRRG